MGMARILAMAIAAAFVVGCQSSEPTAETTPAADANREGGANMVTVQPAISAEEANGRAGSKL